MNHRVSQLIVYPIKSLSGVSIKSASLSDAGIQLDRKWMLVDKDHHFITQREIPELVLFTVEILPDGLIITHPSINESCLIPLEAKTKEVVYTKVWNDSCMGNIVSQSANAFFSSVLHKDVELIQFSTSGNRVVTHHAETRVRFSDSNQYVILGEAALDHLNAKLSCPLPMNRFRPNIVFTGGNPHSEDSWQHVQIGDTHFEAVKSCARCQVTTIDQKTGAIGIEPMKTMATYRRYNNKILFGRHLKMTSSLPAKIHVGDEVIGN
jgi:uncharacterized protein YcbX